jgi:hypothetical protein
VGSADPLSAGQCQSTRVPTNVGKVCIDLKSKDRRVSLSIVDDVLGYPAFFYMFLDASRGCVGDGEGATDGCPNAGSVCGSARNIAVPRGAVRLEVFPSGAALGTLTCTVEESADSPGPAVAGTITAKIVTYY